MRQQFLGVLVGAAFGTVFVLVNSGAPVPAGIAWPVRALAVAVFAVVVVLGIRAGGRPTLAGRPMFGPLYRLAVAGEAVLVVGGFLVLALFDAPPQANVAWIATVVGLHFGVLAAVWGTRAILVVGVLLVLLGGTGLALLGTPALPWVPGVSGVLSGVVLLAGSLYGVTGGAGRGTGSPPHRS